MPDNVGARYVPEGKLRLDRVPVALLGSAAIGAQQRAGLEAADFVIIAVPPGQAAAMTGPLEDAARRMPAQ